jgi:hypothetical protein
VVAAFEQKHNAGDEAARMNAITVTRRLEDQRRSEG